MEVVVIPLTNWQDPQGDLVLIYSERECAIFFGCWEASGQPADYIGCLSFQGAAAVRSFERESIPYQMPARTAHSYILLVHDSDWQREHVAYRQQRYPRSSGQPRQHFVVVGHDIYHEVLAASFTEATIAAADLTDERLLVLHRST